MTIASLPILNNDDGAAAIEYSLIAALIAAIIVGTVTLVGQDVLALLTAFSAAWP